MKLIKIVILFCFLSFCLIGFGKPNVNLDSLKMEVNKLKQQIERSLKQLEEQSKTITTLNSRLEFQNSQIDCQTSLLDTSFDGVSAQLSASSNFIGIFGIIIAVFSIALSLYVGRIAKNINKISQDNETLLQRNVNVKQDIEALSEKITNDSRGLYKLMRTEETNHILDRLIAVPEDIKNIFSNLASRELDEHHFLQLKEAYLQIKKNPEYAEPYLVQFFQHFAGIAITDEEIKVAIISNLKLCIESSFKNDIVKSTNDFLTAIIKKGLNISTTEINAYIKAISVSEFKDLEELYFSLFNTLSNRENQFAFYQIIEKTDLTKKFRINYGKLLQNYSMANPTITENLTFTEISNLNQQ